MIRNLKIDSLKEYEPYKNAIRPQTEEEYNKLKENIKKNGQIDPIRIDDQRRVLDGYSRLAIAKEYGETTIKTFEVEFPFKNDAEAIAWIVDMNISRRHFSREELMELIVEKHAEVKADVGERRGGDTTKKQKSQDDDFAPDEATVEKEPKKSVAKMTAEAVEKETGQKVSESTVQRAVKEAKDKKDGKPKKEKPLPPAVKIVLMLRRTSVKSWEGMREIFKTKTEAREHVKKEREEGNPMYDVEIQYVTTEVTFFTDYDKKSFLGV